MPESELRDMVAWLRRGGFLSTSSVEKAMLEIDRVYFVPESERPLAYTDNALPVGYGQTISAPSVVAFMLDRLEVKKGMKVLEVGTGSGYNCALLSHLVGIKGKVYSFDIVPELTELAKENMKKAGLNTENWKLATGDASCGFEEEAPFDRIIVTAAMPYFGPDHPLSKQVTENGKLIAPVGDRMFQDLILYDKKSGSMEKILPVMFVPLIGKCGFKKE